jgi:hypothetical protein
MFRYELRAIAPVASVSYSFSKLLDIRILQLDTDIDTDIRFALSKKQCATGLSILEINHS